MKCFREAIRSTLTSFLWLLEFFQFYQLTWSVDLWPLIPRSDEDRCGLWSFSTFLNLLWVWCQDHWKSIGCMFPLWHLFICSRTIWECCSLNFIIYYSFLPVGLAMISLIFSISCSVNSPALYKFQWDFGFI